MFDSSSGRCAAWGTPGESDPRASQLPAPSPAWGWAGWGRGRRRSLPSPSLPTPSPRSPHPLPFLGRPGGPAGATSPGSDERGGARRRSRRRRRRRGSHARAPPRPEPAPGYPPPHGPAAGVSGSDGRGAAARPAMSPLFSWVAKVGGVGAASGRRPLRWRMALGAGVPAGAVPGTFVTVGP